MSIKKLVMLLFVAMTMTTVSCSKDDNKTTAVDSPIVGSWEMVGRADERNDYVGTVWTFGKDGKWIIDDDYDSGTYSVEGNVLTMYGDRYRSEPDDEHKEMSDSNCKAHFSINGNSLTLSFFWSQHNGHENTMDPEMVFYFEKR